MKKNQLLYYSPSITWAFFILVICLLPASQIPRPFFYRSELVIHFVCYLLLGVFIRFAWYKSNKKPKVQFLIATWAGMALFGLMIEVLQAVLPIHRNFSFEDFAVNSAGAAILFFQNKLNALFLRWNL